ncbi:MAG TPA: phage holin family protein [Bacteroidales bacterium]|nr:phage holin family protein [Bacteroidales bacterium]
METQSIPENFNELTGSIREYIRLRIDLLKLNLTEKLSRIFTMAIALILFFLFFNFIILFASIAFILWFREHVGPAHWGALIVAGFYILLGILVWLLRRPLFVNPVVSQISKILLEEDHETK